MCRCMGRPIAGTFRHSLQSKRAKAQIVYVQVPDANDMESWPALMPPSKEYLLAYADKRIAIERLAKMT